MSEPANPDDQPETHPRHDFLNHRRRFALNQIAEMKKKLRKEDTADSPPSPQETPR